VRIDGCTMERCAVMMLRYRWDIVCGCLDYAATGGSVGTAFRGMGELCSTVSRNCVPWYGDCVPCIGDCVPWYGDCVPRYGGLCSTVWGTVFHGMGDFVPQYGGLCSALWGLYSTVWRTMFHGMEDYVPQCGRLCSAVWGLYSTENYVPRYGGLCSTVWETLFCGMGGTVFHGVGDSYNIL